MAKIFTAAFQKVKSNPDNIHLNTLPFHNCYELFMSSECDSPDCYRESTWRFQMEDFQTKGLYNLHLNIKCLWPKIDEICFIVKQSNASIIGISESKKLANAN